MVKDMKVNLKISNIKAKESKFMQMEVSTKENSNKVNRLERGKEYHHMEKFKKGNGLI